MERWAPALVVAAGFLALHRGLLSGEQVYRRDSWTLFVGLRDFLGASLRGGSFPGWFPYDGLGLPFHAQALGAALHPTSWLLLVAPAERVLAVQVLAALLLAAVGSWHLALRLGASRWGAATAAASYALGGYASSMTANVQYLWGACSLPLLAALFVGGARRGFTPGVTAGVAATFASVVFMGDLQGAFFFTPAALLLGAATAPTGRRARAAAGGALAAILGVLAAAPQLLPSALLARETLRQGGALPWAEASYWSLHPLRLPELVLPAFHLAGAPGRSTQLFGAHPPLLFWAEALGGSAVLSLLAVGGLLGRRRERVALAALALLGLLLALGRWGGLYRALFEFVPGVSSFRWPEKLVPLFLVAWSALGAIGLRSPAIRRWRVAGAASAALALAGGACLAAGAPTVSGAYRQDLGIALLLGGVTLALFAIVLRARPAAAGPVAVLLVLFEVAAGSSAVLDTRPVEDSAPTPPAVAAARARGAGLGAFRILSVAPPFDLDERHVATVEERRFADLRRSLVAGEWGARYGLESAQAYLQGCPAAWQLLVLHPRFHDLAPLFAVAVAVVPPSAPAGGAVGVRELARPRPRAYLAGGLPSVDVSRLPGALGELPRGLALVSAARDAEPPLEGGTATVARYAPDAVDVDCVAPRTAWLVLNDLHAAGWSARLDGRDVPIARANGVVRAVRVPAGAHRVSFAYRVPGLALGTLLLVAAASFLAVWTAWRRTRERDVRRAAETRLSP